MPVEQHRSDAYIAAQGYVDTMREVVLARLDTGAVYYPTEEAYQLPAVQVSLEGDRHSVSEIGALAVKFVNTDNLKTFLEDLDDANNLYIEVLNYQLFREKEKYPIWSGVLERLPEGEEVYPAETITLNFITPAGVWLDAGDVTHPATSEWYINSHVTDELLPALLDAAKDDAGFVSDIQEPWVASDVNFWSGIDRPKKYLADKNQAFDITCRTTALCWGNGLLYVGVHDARTSAKPPWIVSYNPTTRIWRKVTRALYVGSKSFLKPPTEWEFQSLEYVAGTIYYVCRTNHPELLDQQAHYHCHGSFAVAAAPEITELVDAHLFTLHDRGQTIKAKPLYYDNRPYPVIDGVTYYAYMNMQMIGWGTPRHKIKECSILFPNCRRFLEGPGGYLTVVYGSNWVLINKTGVKETDPKVGDYLIAKESNHHFIQNMGRILKVDDYGIYWRVRTEMPSAYFYTGASTWKFYPFSENCASQNNVFIAEPQDISIEYLFPNDVGSFDSEPILIERRKHKYDAGSFYWPAIVSEVDEDGLHRIDDIGYFSFAAIKELDSFFEDATNKKYIAGESAPFKITLKGYNPAFLISQGFWVASALQNSAYGQPAPCRLIHNGNTVKLQTGEELKTRGNIFLHYDGSRVWVAWNDHAQSDNGDWFSRCNIGYWDGSVVRLTWRDRDVNNWGDYPETYWTSFIRFNGLSYGGRLLNERSWKETRLRVFYAAPPQDVSSPRFYDNRLTAICGVKGDKTELLENGAVIRMRYSNKTYRIADVSTATRDFAGGAPFCAPDEVPYLGDLTYFVLIAMDSPPKGMTHAQQIASELKGQYIDIAKGRNRRAQIARVVNSAWDVVATARVSANAPLEGGEVAYHKLRWKDELATIVYEDVYTRMPRVLLNNKHVIAGTVIVTLTESNEELEVDDLTNYIESLWYQSWPEPAANKCYLHRRQGDDADEAYLYFNGSLEGLTVNIAYDYYDEALYETPFLFQGTLYFAESGPRYKIRKSANGTTWTDDYSPRLGDSKLEAVTTGTDDVYGVSSPSWLLIHYGKQWTNYITVPVIGTDVPIWQIVGSLARTANCYCWERNGKVYLRRRSSYSSVTPFKNIISVKEISPVDYKRVVLSYANGQTALGEGKPELQLSIEYAFDKGHADAICREIFDYYTTGRREFEILYNGTLDDVELLSAKKFEYEGKYITGLVTGVIIAPDNTTLFKISEVQREAFA
jgi:hypothetical protein